jgi:hypothetical protein
MTPPPLQPRLQIWCAGPTHSVAMERGLGHLADADSNVADLATAWRAADTVPAALGAPRARRLDAGPADTLLAALVEGRAAFDQDWAAVLGDGTDAQVVGREVRPRVQIESLPHGLENLWSSPQTSA